jgi:hypothetical protein
MSEFIFHSVANFSVGCALPNTPTRNFSPMKYAVLFIRPSSGNSGEVKEGPSMYVIRIKWLAGRWLPLNSLSHVSISHKSHSLHEPAAYAHTVGWPGGPCQITLDQGITFSSGSNVKSCD